MTIPLLPLLLPLLYSRGKKNKILTWQVETNGTGFRTIRGQHGGKLVTDAWTVCEPMNPGKANATSADSQARKEARAKHADKLKKGYTPDIAEIDNVIPFQVMLAEEYRAITAKRPLVFPQLVQPKLDGVRCRGNRAPKLFSRENNEFHSCPHIRAQVALVLADLGGPADVDGELYNHDLKDDFDELIHLIRTSDPKKLTPEFLAETREKIQYWVYDVMLDLPTEERSRWVAEKFKDIPFVAIVPTHIVNNQAELDARYEEFLLAGFEGMMIRDPRSTYVYDRDESLLKRKEHIDLEFPLVDILEGVGNRSGKAGKVVCRLPDGRTFEANVKGKFEFLTRFLRTRADHIGKPATIRFQSYTPDGIPRFGRMTAIRDYE